MCTSGSRVWPLVTGCPKRPWRLVTWCSCHYNVRHAVSELRLITLQTLQKLLNRLWHVAYQRLVTSPGVSVSTFKKKTAFVAAHVSANETSYLWKIPYFSIWGKTSFAKNKMNWQNVKLWNLAHKEDWNSPVVYLVLESRSSRNEDSLWFWIFCFPSVPDFSREWLVATSTSRSLEATTMRVQFECWDLLQWFATVKLTQPFGHR